MSTEQHENATDQNDTDQNDTSQDDTLDPRDTDHPTGAKQAAENAVNDPPS